MSAPLEFDSQMTRASLALETAGEIHRYELADYLKAARQAAADLTDRQLTGWTSSTTRLWEAQRRLASRHGVLASAADPSRQVMRAQVRRSWLGNLVGISVPLALFGASMIDHSFLLPLFWMAAVVADVAGRTSCLQRTHLETAPIPHAPGIAGAFAAAAIRIARQTSNWAGAKQQAEQITVIDTTIHQRDSALREGRRYGQALGIASVLLVMISAAASMKGLFGEGVIPWIALVASIGGVFGVASWITSFSYAEALEQPPYSARGSATLLTGHVNHEAMLAEVNVTDITTRATIEEVITPAMKARRCMNKALRSMQKAELRVEDARWQIAILRAERG